MWDVQRGDVHEYEGGYSDYVFARAERERIAATEEAKRQNLVRKELAWLRRGAPARTSKPRFRIEAANELIADVPPPRDSSELMKFASLAARQDRLRPGGRHRPGRARRCCSST